VDWNEDGMKDLITGENSGNVRIYLNTNSDADPVFRGFEYVKLSGVNFDAGSYSVPFIVDWNNDGKKDLIVGDSVGKVALLINEGTNAAPVFNTKVFIKNGPSDLDAGTTVSPAAVDLNRDGKKDLIVGESNGHILYYENLNTDADPQFNGSEQLREGPFGKIIDVEYYARVNVCDWNNDGVMDIICGNRNYNAAPSGGVFFFEYVGPLSLSSNAISAGSGGKVSFSLHAEAANAGRNYLVLGGVTGTSPGTPLPGGLILPVNWDVFTDLTLSLMNSPIFSNFMGTLDATGKANALLDAPAVPSALGLVMSYGYALNNPWDYASNGADIEFVP
jgi:hypothetical protein